MSLIKKAVKTCINAFNRWLDEENQSSHEIIPFDNNYKWLRANHLQFTKDPICAKHPAYTWGVLQGAALAKILGIERISAIEFGVAGGRGLLAMERAAELAEETTGVGIDVYGFDTKSGLPKPQDYRDLPNIFFDGQYPMDESQLEKRLRRARLKLGLVEETVPRFQDSNHSPIAFVSVDLDLYSSTMHALKVFEVDERLLLPRIVCYYDDILGHTYSDFNGERLAISEFNAAHSMRKFSPVYGLKYYVPPQHKSSLWTEKFYFLHLFDHSLYNHPDSLSKDIRIDVDGKVKTDLISRAVR